MLSLSDLNTFSLVIGVCDKYGADPSGSGASYEFFEELLSQYQGPTDPPSIRNWLREQIPEHFVALRRRPKWIQGSEWPYANGKPMIFAGQIDLNQKEREKIEPTYHDDTSLYVFIAPMEDPVVVIQQY
jgi:hypothetical protein